MDEKQVVVEDEKRKLLDVVRADVRKRQSAPVADTVLAGAPGKAEALHKLRKLLPGEFLQQPEASLIAGSSPGRRERNTEPNTRALLQQGVRQGEAPGGIHSGHDNHTASQCYLQAGRKNSTRTTIATGCGRAALGPRRSCSRKRPGPERRTAEHNKVEQSGHEIQQDCSCCLLETHLSCMWGKV